MEHPFTDQPVLTGSGKTATEASTLTTIQEQVDHQHTLLCVVKENLTAVHAKLSGIVPSTESDEVAPSPDKPSIQAQLNYNSTLLKEIRSILEELTERV